MVCRERRRLGCFLKGGKLQALNLRTNELSAKGWEDVGFRTEQVSRGPQGDLRLEYHTVGLWEKKFLFQSQTKTGAEYLHGYPGAQPTQKQWLEEKAFRSNQ